MIDRRTERQTRPRRNREIPSKEIKKKIGKE